MVVANAMRRGATVSSLFLLICSWIYSLLNMVFLHRKLFFWPTPVVLPRLLMCPLVDKFFALFSSFFWLLVLAALARRQNANNK